MAVQGPWAVDIVSDWLVGKTIKVMLLDPSYTPNPDHSTTADVVELSATGYTAGGVVATGVAATYTSDQVGVLDCDDVVFSAVDSTAIGGVAFYESGTGALIATDMFGPISTVGTGFTYLVSPSGFVLLTPAA